MRAEALQRLNLNLPAETRERLRGLAKAARQPEAVVARELLVAAIERAEREAFRESVRKSRSDARKARDLEIASAMERARG